MAALDRLKKHFMNEETGDIYAIIDEKIEADTEFQDSLTDLSDEDKQQLIAEKKSELVKSEFSALLEKTKKAEEIKENQEIRAKKAEMLAKTLKLEKETPKNDFSLNDIRALSDVHDEDVEEVVNLAKLRNISVAEAKKDQYIIAYLKTRIEERASAANTNTNTTRRTNFKTPDEELVKKVKNNEDMTDDEMKLAARQMVESFNKR